MEETAEKVKPSRWRRHVRHKERRTKNKTRVTQLLALRRRRGVFQARLNPSLAEPFSLARTLEFSSLPCPDFRPQSLYNGDFPFLFPSISQLLEPQLQISQTLEPIIHSQHTSTQSNPIHLPPRVSRYFITLSPSLHQPLIWGTASWDWTDFVILIIG